jgi:hypothetical protein
MMAAIDTLTDNIARLARVARHFGQPFTAWVLHEAVCGVVDEPERAVRVRDNLRECATMLRDPRLPATQKSTRGAWLRDRAADAIDHYLAARAKEAA